MYLSIFETRETGAEEGLTIDPASLYRAFEHVRDGRKRFPTHSTYSEVRGRCDGEQIVIVIAGVLLKARAVEHSGSDPSRRHSQQQDEALTPIALDGKTLCRP